MISKIGTKIYSFILRLNYNLRGKSLGRRLRVEVSSKLELSKNSFVRFENGVCFRKNCVLKVRNNACLTIGENVTFNDNCNITVRYNVVIGKNTLFGPNVVIIDNDHNYKSNDWMSDFICSEVVIEEDVWIGANCVILKGTHIGKGAIIAAGTIVRGDIQSNELVYEERVYKKKLVIKEYF
ncbi:acyltransferase [Enterocloster aldenensis]|uniref:acyltransferase n=1 Tax=Enterocloster aldenensis TaxID=358742 RepID=UPI000E4C805D|nr:acyltransferase [Enterocloster aldenensis]